MKSTNDSNKFVPTNIHLKHLFWLYRLRKSRFMPPGSLKTNLLQTLYSLIGDIIGKALVQWCLKAVNLETHAQIMWVPSELVFDV